MKKILFASLLAATFVGCQNEEEMNLQEERFKVEATMGVQSRTSLQKDNKTVVWSEGDKIYLLGGNSRATMTLTSGAGEETATFSGSIYGFKSQLTHALYPVPTIDENTYTYEFPAEIAYTENSNAPMIAEYSAGETLSFSNLSAMVRIPLVNLDAAKENVVELTMTGITGTATVDLNDKKLTFGETGDVVTVTIPAGVSSCNVDIPVPTGTYSGYNIKVNQNIIKKNSEITLTAQSVAICEIIPADGATVVSSAEEIEEAVDAGKTNLYLKPGEYKNIAGCAGKTLTISGTKGTVLKVVNMGENGCDYTFGAAGSGIGDITFNGVTINTAGNNGTYKGYAYMKGTFNNCSFYGAYSLNNSNDFVFNYCEFDFNNGYFWTWAAKSVTFNGCKFNGNSKAILAHGSASTTIKIVNCNFNAAEKGYTGSGDNTACVEIDPAGQNVYTITFAGTNTKTECYSGWTRVKDESTGHTISGVN